MIMILWAELASRSNGSWPGKSGCRNFWRGCCEKINIRKEPLERGNVRPACQSGGNGWLRQGSYQVLQGALFFNCRKKIWLSHIHEEAPPTKHPPHSTRQQSSGQVWPALPGPPKTTTSHRGRSSSARQSPYLGLWACRGGALFRREMCPREAPLLLCTSPEEQVATVWTSMLVWDV